MTAHLKLETWKTYRIDFLSLSSATGQRVRRGVSHRKTYELWEDARYTDSFAVLQYCEQTY